MIAKIMNYTTAEHAHVLEASSIYKDRLPSQNIVKSATKLDKQRFSRSFMRKHCEEQHKTYEIKDILSICTDYVIYILTLQ
jgi:hypothetical protein